MHSTIKTTERFLSLSRFKNLNNPKILPDQRISGRRDYTRLRPRIDTKKCEFCKGLNISDLSFSLSHKNNDSLLKQAIKCESLQTVAKHQKHKITTFPQYVRVQIKIQFCVTGGHSLK